MLDHVEEKILPEEPGQLSLKQKLDYCTAWEKSGLSKVEFCKAQNITKNQFKYWYYQLYSKKKSTLRQWTPVVAKSKQNILLDSSLQLEFELPHQVILRVKLSADCAVPFIQELSHAIATIR